MVENKVCPDEVASFVSFFSEGFYLATGFIKDRDSEITPIGNIHTFIRTNHNLFV